MGQTGGMQIVETSEKATLRGKRRRVDQIPAMTRKKLPEQFEIRGAESVEDLAKVYEAQWSAVMSLLVHHLYKRIRILESQQIMRGAASADRKEPARERSGLRLVQPLEAA